MGIRDRAERCNQHRARRSLRSAKDRLVELERAFVMVELRFEPALEITFLFLVGQRGRAGFVENAARARVIAFLQKQLDRAQLGAVGPLRVAQQGGKQCSASSKREPP